MDRIGKRSVVKSFSLAVQLHVLFLKNVRAFTFAWGCFHFFWKKWNFDKAARWRTLTVFKEYESLKCRYLYPILGTVVIVTTRKTRKMRERHKTWVIYSFFAMKNFRRLGIFTSGDIFYDRRTIIQFPVSISSFFQKSRSSLERYLFYCNRYMNHIQSAKLEFEVLWDRVRCARTIGPWLANQNRGTCTGRSESQ